jgi:gamma-glutamyltranspeptidase/glutathione hydrolase
VVDGWWEAHRYSRETMGSRLRWPDLLADAIAYAHGGFGPSAGQRLPPPREPDLFGDGAASHIRRDLWPLYHPDALARGPLIQADLGRTLEAVAEGGREAFYHGDLPRRIVSAASAAGSPLSLDDFGAHRSEWMEPLTIAYGCGVAASFPPPAQGLSALAMLAMSEAFDVGALPESDYVHVLVEAAKLAFADRDRHLTDPDFMSVAPAELLAPERLRRLAGRISLARALPPGTAAAAAGDTIAIVAADRDGNAVSLIQSLYFTWGSALVAGDTGVVLQNRGSFFSLDPSAANALAPSKRTMHTLIPSMYLEDGRARFVYGTMGGEGQPQTQAAIVTRRLRRGLGPQAAVEAPRWLYGRTWGTPSRGLHLEGRYPDTLARDLAARGHDVERAGEWDDLFGHAQCVWLPRHEEHFAGGSDPRADGAAVGW